MAATDEPGGFIAPGAERTLEAGETLKVTDREGTDFYVTAKESDVVITFIKAFDTWNAAKNTGTGEPVIGSLLNEVVRTFHCLPPRIIVEMPSYKAASIGLTSHKH